MVSKHRHHWWYFNDASKAGPTSVLANPGWQFYQLRGYVPVTTATGDGYTTVADVIIPSPYKNDDTRVNITGMVVTADADRPAYVYRTAVSVASGWGDGRVAVDGLTTLVLPRSSVSALVLLPLL